jgi:hypothetical protein
VGLKFRPNFNLLLTSSHLNLTEEGWWVQILRDAKVVPGQRHQSVDMGSWDEEQLITELQLGENR